MDGRSKLNTTEKEEGSVTVVIQSVLRVVQFMPRSIRILPVSYTSTPFRPHTQSTRILTFPGPTFSQPQSVQYASLPF